VLLANRHGKWCLALVALAGIAFVSVEAIWQAHINELNRQASVANLAEDALNNRELKGLRRAAWMLGKAFGPREFSEEQFLKDKKYELRLYGEFRWDKLQQKLVITQHLFTTTSSAKNSYWTLRRCFSTRCSLRDFVRICKVDTSRLRHRLRLKRRGLSM